MCRGRRVASSLKILSISRSRGIVQANGDLVDVQVRIIVPANTIERQPFADQFQDTDHGNPRSRDAGLSKMNIRIDFVLSFPLPTIVLAPPARMRTSTASERRHMKFILSYAPPKRQQDHFSPGSPCTSRWLCAGLPRRRPSVRNRWFPWRVRYRRGSV